MDLVLVPAFAAITLILIVLGIYQSNLKICQPNEVLVFSGRGRTLADGSQIGYRVIRGGRSFRWPIIEKVDRLDLTVLPIELRVENAYSKGGIPLTVRGVANVKVASQEPELNNAIERLLGKSRDEIQTISKETLEGNLRGVLALLTPEEVNEDRLKFAKNLIEEADADLSALGVQLDTLKIQSVEDDRGYLDAIGRQQTAQIIAAAEVAEAKNEEQARLAQARAEKSIIRAQN
ncbi:MAG: flotillin family protein, partial [Bacteroidota bacterium]